MKKRRRLSDLYIRGKEFSIDDGSGDPVVVWLQKPNEIDRESVLRRANAAKARYQIDSDHEEGELFVATLGSVRDFLDRDGMLDIAAAEQLFRLRERIEAELTEDDEGWGKDDKIKSLLDAWTGTDEEPGLAAKFAEDENDPEAVRVKGEIEAFNADVDARVDRQKSEILTDWEDLPDAELIRATAREILKRRADETFMREWSRQQVFYGVREPDDHQKRYFGTLVEVDDLDERVRAQLETTLNEMYVNASEGKDSPPTVLSSNSSGLPSEAAESKASGPDTAAK